MLNRKNMFHAKSLGMIYVERSKFTYYPFVGNTVSFTFPTDAIQEIEVVDEELFLKEAETFLTSNKLAPANVIVVIAPELLYEKEILDENAAGEKKEAPPSVPGEKDKTAAQVSSIERARQVQIFLDVVPFEETGSKVYKIDKGIKIIATNKDLYELIKNAFIKQGFTVDAVVPSTMLAKDLVMTGEMTDDFAKKIMAKFEIVRQNTLLEQTPQAMVAGATENTGPHLEVTTKVSSKREYALIGVFVCLLLILGGVTYTTLIAPPAPKKIASLSQVPPPPTPTVIVSPTPDASASASVKRDILRIQITGGTSLQTDLLRQQLVASGFTNVTTKPSNVPATGKTLIIFSNTLSEPAKQVILDEVKKNLLNVSVQQNTVSDADAIVNL